MGSWIIVKHLLLAGVVCVGLSAASATAQLTEEQTRQRMEELNRKATAERDRTPGADAGKTEWTAKQDAPPAARVWVHNLPAYKKRDLAIIQYTLSTIQDADPAERKKKQDAARDLGKSIEDDPWYIGWPGPLGREKGNIGTLSPTVVVQIMDETNMIVKKGEDFYWITNVVTDRLKDGDRCECRAVVVAGTKHYTEPGRAAKTVPMLEPIDLARNVEEPREAKPTLAAPIWETTPGIPAALLR
ncbi:MAG: hypothetical protein ABSH20_20025 [Tepidisphaeraceae bacterium]|jgi:hypothetical protein